MTKIIRVICDNCGKDLSLTGSKPAYRIFVSQERIPHDPNIDNIFALNFPPLFDDELHFCEVQCLTKYFNHMSKNN